MERSEEREGQREGGRVSSVVLYMLPYIHREVICLLCMSIIKSGHSMTPNLQHYIIIICRLVGCVKIIDSFLF